MLEQIRKGLTMMGTATASPAATRLPLLVWILRNTVLPSKPFRLSPRSSVTPCFSK